ncbi:hypothetical protein QQ054_00965 [Oscillatoria amoena NRMC-F 0135]|nr:hypothetical protein [Oscillatoria amoena NRMC-F 0135]
MITEELKALVRQEADNLKIHATTQELSYLSFQTIDPDQIFNCIYGQMTGDCTNFRAVELLNYCAVPYSNRLDIYEQPRKQEFKRFFLMNNPFSAIEFYIYQIDAKNENLISYLKGETDNLEL